MRNTPAMSQERERESGLSFELLDLDLPSMRLPGIVQNMF